MPKIVHDPILGPMAWDAETGCWLGEIELAPRQRVGVLVEDNDENQFEADISVSEARLAVAREWVDRVRRREPEYRRWLADRLVDRRWNEEQPMTADDIERLLRLVGIECETGGTARLNWDDDDMLFAGHNVVIWLGPDGECVSGGME